MKQGEIGDAIHLLLDGVVRVDVDGKTMAEVGRGAILGERAALEGGRRTATLIAITPCRLAVASTADIDSKMLFELSQGHRREERP